MRGAKMGGGAKVGYMGVSDGLDKLDTMVMEGGRGGGREEGGREGGRDLHLQGKLDGMAGEDGGDDVSVLGVAVFQDLGGGREGGREGGRVSK